jgi:Flp pilus assembly protein TadD
VACFPNFTVAHGLLASARIEAPNALQPRKAGGIVSKNPMNARVATLVAVAALASASPSFADARRDAKAQVEFGINVAQRGLWREAIYRWEKAVEIDPTYAAAFNDLAIAYEHEGQLEKARKAYEKALELDPNNSQVRQNYELFKEINDRTGSGKDKP